MSDKRANFDVTMDLISVEYPGYINNIPQAVETLGGLHVIERVYP